MAFLFKSVTARIPSTPQFIVITDRDDGTLWTLSHDVTGDYIAINDQGLNIGGSLPSEEWTDVRFYGPYEGPYLAIPTRLQAANPRLKLRLLIRGGYLGYELIEDPTNTGHANHRVLTRRGLSRVYREIIVPQEWVNFYGELDVAGWEDNPET